MKPPGPCDETPLKLEDNPSKGFFHPLSHDEIEQELKALPNKDWRSITHVWLKRVKRAEYENGDLPLAEFVCGSGVRAVILYPFPKSMKQVMGPRKPAQRLIRCYQTYQAQLIKEGDDWIFQWQMAGLKNFYAEQLLYHEIGHNIELYRGRKFCEEFADQYAYARTNRRKIYYDA